MTNLTNLIRKGTITSKKKKKGNAEITVESTVEGHNSSHKTAKKDAFILYFVMNALFGQRQHHTVLRKKHTYRLLCPL